MTESATLLSPVQPQERIHTLDIIRGFALLGILLMNISEFSGPLDFDYHPDLVGNGIHHQWNIAAWALRWILFEGKMRFAFSMLFGAGVVLLTSRMEQRGAADKAADIFCRRNLWLLLFGIIHGYFIWFGDILFIYGLTALIFLYPMRKLKPKTLLIAGACVLLALTPLVIAQALDERQTFTKAEAAMAIERQGKPLNDTQKANLKKLSDLQEKENKDRIHDTEAMRGGYLQNTMRRSEREPAFQAMFYYQFGFCDFLGAMLIGMGLLKSGFLTGDLSTRAYFKIAAVCLPIGLGLGTLSAWRAIHAGFWQPSNTAWLLIPYETTRALGAIGMVSVVILVVKVGRLRALTEALAAVGRTAFSNYILTSVLCSFIFNGIGLGLYGKLEFYQLFPVMAGVWLVNVTASVLWLKYFRFGPLEWCWRSLTYWNRQPMRKTTEQKLAAATL